VDYISHLIGHESEGSILSVLKAKGWANSLGAMLYQTATIFSCFAIDISLTDVGVDFVNDILSVVFEYIGEHILFLILIFRCRS
jgi:insulysin